jgi:hypothetical protein
MVPSTVKTWAPASIASGAGAVDRGGATRVARRGDHEAGDAERARAGDGHPEPARLERAGRILSLVLGPEVPQAQMRGEPGQREQRRAPFAERDRLLAIGERQQLAEAVHPGRAARERLLGEGRGDARQIVADREHLAALRADGEHAPRIVALPADRALDVGDEAHYPP